MDQEWILLIEDDDVQAKIFRMQIMLNDNLQVENLELQHVRSVREALSWLGQTQIIPLMICLDLGLPDLPVDKPELACNHLKEAAPGSEIVILTGRDKENPAVKKLERKLGSEQVFFKQEMYRNRDQQTILLEKIHDAVAKRTSSSSRERDIALTRLQERLNQIEEELDNREPRITKLETTVFYGASDSSQSLVYIVQSLSNEIKQVTKAAEADRKELAEITKQINSGTVQVRMMREKYIVIGLAVVIVLVALSAMGIDLRDFLVALVKAFGGKD